MNVFFTSQGDIIKVGQESSSLSGAFLKTLPSIFSVKFLSELYRACLRALALTITRLRLQNYSRTNPVHPG